MTRVLPRPQAELMPGLRSTAIGRYVVFYEAIEGGLDVLRVLHGSRDIESMFDH